MATPALGMGPQQNNAAEFAINTDLFRLPPHQVQQAKAEIGIPQERDNRSLTLNEKVGVSSIRRRLESHIIRLQKRLLEFCQRRFPKPPAPPPTMHRPPATLRQWQPLVCGIVTVEVR